MFARADVPRARRPALHCTALHDAARVARARLLLRDDRRPHLPRRPRRLRPLVGGTPPRDEDHGPEGRRACARDRQARRRARVARRRCRGHPARRWAARRRRAQFVVETEALKDGWTIAQQLIYAANHVNNRRGILVMGAAGGGAEGKAHPAGNPPMGSVARDALHRVKVPLVLVRGNPTRAPSKSDVASPPAAAASAAAAADGGAHARAPMTVAVCVDDDSVSDHAFDVRRAISESTHRNAFRLRRTADADAHHPVTTHRTGRHSVLQARRRPRCSPRRRC